MRLLLNRQVSSKKFFCSLFAIFLFFLCCFTGGAETQSLSFSPSLEEDFWVWWNPAQGKGKPSLFSLRSDFNNEEEEEEYREYHGFGLSIKIMGGWNYFSGGEIRTGIEGLFDQRAADVSSRGYTTASRTISRCNSGPGLAAEAVYHLHPRIGLGIRLSASHPAHPSKLLFYQVQAFPYSLWSDVGLKIVSVMVGVHYFIPIHRRVRFYLSGGPELHFVSYQYSLNFTTPSLHEEINQKAESKGIGGRGSAGLEVFLNPRVALFLEAHGRLAKISRFKGKEALYYEENYQVSTSEQEGFLYYSRAGKYPGLSIFSDDHPSAQKGNKAVFNFSGFGLNLGMNFKF